MRNKGLIALVVIVVLVLIFGGSFMGTFNNLQRQDESITSNWAQVENQLQRRSDLIPNLVSTVKGYAKHEKEVFTNIADARSKLAGAVQSKDVNGVNKANTEFSGALSRLLMIAENYPQLKANTNFTALQDEIAGTENRLAVARRDYNESVKQLNGNIRTFPTNIVAGMSNIKAREYFNVEENKKALPEVNFE